MVEVTYTQHEGHEPTQDGEQNVAALIAEAASRLKQYEGRHKEGSNGVQQGPVHRGQQATRCSLPLALCMS